MNILRHFPGKKGRKGQNPRLFFCSHCKAGGKTTKEKNMNTAQPIRKYEDLINLKEYYKSQNPNVRNELLITIGLNTALRISDILTLKWEDVYDFERKKYRSHIIIYEQKTGKESHIYINEHIRDSLENYKKYLREHKHQVRRKRYLFSHANKNVPISRVQAFRIIKEAAKYSHIPGVICCHSLRKTFGYHAWRQGTSPALLMNIYNHSSYQVTRRYLGIEQDDRDKIFERILL
jgi:integrase